MNRKENRLREKEEKQQHSSKEKEKNGAKLSPFFLSLNNLQKNNKQETS